MLQCLCVWERNVQAREWSWQKCKDKAFNAEWQNIFSEFTGQVLRGLTNYIFLGSPVCWILLNAFTLQIGGFLYLKIYKSWHLALEGRTELSNLWVGRHFQQYPIVYLSFAFFNREGLIKIIQVTKKCFRHKISHLLYNFISVIINQDIHLTKFFNDLSWSGICRSSQPHFCFSNWQIHVTHE